MPQTGPRTTAGKARSRANAVKHGLRAETPLVSQLEDPKDWQRHLEGVIVSLEPEGYVESELTTRIASLLWRLRRVSAYEANSMSNALEGIPAEVGYSRDIAEIYHKPREPITMDEIVRRASSHMFPGHYIINNVMRYEAHLHRLYIQTLHELEAIQGRRNGERTPLARLDITGAPSG